MSKPRNTYLESGGSTRSLLTPLLAVVVLVCLSPGEGIAHAVSDNPAGSLALQWRKPQIVATYAIGMLDTMGLRVRSDPARARVAVVDRQLVLEGVALAFDVDDAFAFDVDTTAVVHIDLDATDLDEFFVAYDRNGGPNGLIRVPVEQRQSGWQTFSVTLDRARFANRGFGGTDFAIAGGIDVSDRLLRIGDIGFTLGEGALQSVGTGVIEINTQSAVTRERIAAQVGLYDDTARMPLPGPMAVPLQVFDQHTRLVELREQLDDLSWPHANRYAMYVDGFYRAQVPAGNYDLVVARGPEFEIVTRRTRVRAGETTEIDVVLAHTLDMPARGWFSGDVHNHLTRANSAANALHLAHARAHDLHMHWLNELGNSTTTHFRQFSWGTEGEYREKNYYLASAQEDPRTGYLGHVLSLGQQRRIRRASDYLRYDLAASDTRDAEGILGIARMDLAADVALAMLAPEGAVDFVEVMRFNTVHGRDWYRFLNMGFQLPAAAGSDWPYVALPGSVRTYVQVDGEFTPSSWKQGLRDGRSFVSNGPMLTLSVNGEPIGSRIEARSGDRLRVEALATIEPSRDRLSRMDLIVGGAVKVSVSPETPRASLALSDEFEVSSGTWIAVQAYGAKSRVIHFQGEHTGRNIAHSSPIYVEVNGLSADPDIAARNMSQVIDELARFKQTRYGHNDEETWESAARTAELVGRQKVEVSAWVDRAIDWYENRRSELLSQAQ